MAGYIPGILSRGVVLRGLATLPVALRLLSVSADGDLGVADPAAFEVAGAVSTHAALAAGVHGISDFGGSLVGGADAAAVRATLGLGSAALAATGDFDAAGAAAAAYSGAVADLGDHISALDPHPQYLLQSDGDGLYSALIHTHAYSSLSGIPSEFAPTAHQHAAADISDGSSAGRGLLTAVDAAAQRSLLGLGTAALSAASDFAAAVHSHAFADLTSRPTTLSGYGITDAQPLDSDLTAIAALTTTSFGRSLLVQATAGDARTTLGLVIGTDVQAYDAELAALAGLTSAANKLPYFTGGGTASLADLTAAGRALLDDADAAAQCTTLGLGVGSNVQFNSLTLGNGTGNRVLILDSAVNSTSGFRWSAAGTPRWQFYVTNPETGSDAGCDLVFGRAFTDAGVGIDNPITITRAAGGNITIIRPVALVGNLTMTGNLSVTGTLTMANAQNIAFNTSTGTKVGTATTQKIGFWNATPIVQPSGSAQAAVTLGNTDGAIGGLTIGVGYSQSEVQALRNATETLADDVRALSTLIHGIRTAGVNAGLWKGAA